MTAPTRLRPAPRTPAVSPVGELLRGWRESGRLSPLALADQAEVWTRQLSCVEAAGARPSRQFGLDVAEHLDVPLPGSDELLGAAAFAPE